MHKAFLLAATTVAAITVNGCTQGAKAADPADAQTAIRALETQWEKDYAARDVSALAGHYVDDAALGGPGDPLATSDVDRRKTLAAMLTDKNLKLTFASDRIEVAQSGDLASSRGHYSMTMTDKATGKPATSSGSYLTVYKKQADGSWKAIEDFITPGPAPAAAKS
jgi:uncharacterized protein (TIGR02246 family)